MVGCAKGNRIDISVGRIDFIDLQLMLTSRKPTQPAPTLAVIAVGWVLNKRRQAFVPELKLATGIGLDGNVAIDQAAGKVGAFSTGKVNAVGSAISQSTSLAHLALEPMLAVAALAGHF